MYYLFIPITHSIHSQIISLSLKQMNDTFTAGSSRTVIKAASLPSDATGGKSSTPAFRVDEIDLYYRLFGVLIEYISICFVGMINL